MINELLLSWKTILINDDVTQTVSVEIINDNIGVRHDQITSIMRTPNYYACHH